MHENLGTALEEIGQYDEAIEEYLAARTLPGEDESIVGELREAYTRNELRGFRQKQLQLALSRWTGWHIDAFQIASYYARLDHSTPASARLEKAFEARSGC